MAVEIKDNSVHVKEAINDAIIAWLYEASGELVSQTKRNTRVGSGQLKNSWTSKVDESKGEAIVGSPLENAIWEEFGTGIYAVNGNGRKDVPWTYQDQKGEWHRTKGKEPHRALQSAVNSSKRVLVERLKDILKGMK